MIGRRGERRSLARGHALTSTFGFVLVVFLLGIRIPAQAQTRTVPYEGYLDADGSPVTTEGLDFAFDLYAAEDDDVALWSSGTLVVPVSNGRFAVELGSASENPLPEALFEQSTAYLAVSVEGTALSGRQRIATVPWAVRASQVQLDEVDTPCDAERAGRLRFEGQLEYCDGEDWVSTTPAGAIAAFGGDSPPNGWLVCDGTGVRSADYPALYAAIGTAWGDGSTGCPAADCNFNLPDLRGVFLRGVNDGRSDGYAASGDREAQTGRADDVVGSFQDDAFQSHGHDNNFAQNNWSVAVWYGTGNTIGGTGPINNIPLVVGDPVATSAGEPRDGTETRPANAYVHWIVKY